MKPWHLLVFLSPFVISCASQAKVLGDCNTLPIGTDTMIIEIDGVGEIEMETVNSGVQSGPKRSIAELDEAIKRDPDDAALYIERGKAYCEKGDYDHYNRALADFNAAIERAPGIPGAYVALSSVLWRLRDLDEATAQHGKTVKLTPENLTRENPAVYVNRCEVYFQLRDYERAIAECDEAILLDPTGFRAFYSRGRAHYALGDSERALVDLNEAIRLNPSVPYLYYGRGHIYYNHGKYELAVAEYSQTIQLEPNSPGAFMDRGNAYDEMGEPERAIADYDAALELDPVDPLTYYNRGYTYYRLEDFDRAIEDFSHSIRLDPNYPNAYYNRGRSFEKLGDFDQAIADYAEAGRLNPELTRAILNSAELSYQLGDGEQAIEILDAMLENDPTNPNTLYLRGLVQLSLDAPARAALDFHKVVRQDHSDVQAVLWREIAERRNDWPGQLGEAVSGFSMQAWPAPIVRLYLGQLQSEDVLAATTDSDAEVQRYQLCEAHVFIGEHALLMEDKAEARRHFERARETCRISFTEYSVASAELRRLDADGGD